MYSYYFLATFPSMRSYLWWKPYLTILQIVQFIIIGLHMIWIAVDNCGYPRLLLYYNLIQISCFIGLFLHFYINKYLVYAKANREASIGARQEKKTD